VGSALIDNNEWERLAHGGRRRRRPWYELTDSEPGWELASETTDPAALVIGLDNTQQLWRHLKELAPIERSLIRLRIGLDGPPMTIRAVAARFGIAHSTAWDMECRALATLRALYEADREEERGEG